MQRRPNRLKPIQHWLRRLIELHGETAAVNARLELVYVLTQLGLLREAIHELEGWVVQEPYKHLSAFHGYLGILLLSVATSSSADEQALVASTDRPHSDSQRLLLDATSALCAAVKMDPHCDLFAECCAVALQLSGRDDECIAMLLRLTQLNDSCAAAHRYLRTVALCTPVRVCLAAARAVQSTTRRYCYCIWIEASRFIAAGSFWRYRS